MSWCSASSTSASCRRALRSSTHYRCRQKGLFAEHDLFQIDHVYGNRLIVKAVATGFLALPFSAARVIFVFAVILTDIVLQWNTM